MIPGSTVIVSKHAKMATHEGEKTVEAGQEMRPLVALGGFFALVVACAWAALLFIKASRADVDPLGMSGIEPTLAEWLTSAVAYMIVPFAGVSAVLMVTFGVLRRGALPVRFAVGVAATAAATIGTEIGRAHV